jgi:hypothetical protein
MSSSSVSSPNNNPYKQPQFHQAMPHIPTKPKSDREFFEILSNIIFVAGFRYSVVQAR